MLKNIDGEICNGKDLKEILSYNVRGIQKNTKLKGHNILLLSIDIVTQACIQGQLN